MTEGSRMIRSKYWIINRPIFVTLGGIILALGACDDPAPTKTSASVSAPEPNAFSIATRSWIDVDDKLSPAVWLASREAGSDVGADDPAAASLRRLLHEADIRFTEGPRMVANRAVQVESMLAERGVRESPRNVIEALVSIADVGERAGFGETCQHYVIARAASPDQATALAGLRRQPLPAPAGEREK
jgi:hypothetical protein